MGEESTSLIIEVGSQSCEKELTELVQDVLQGKWAKNIESAIKMPHTKDSIDEVQNYLTGVRCAEKEYDKVMEWCNIEPNGYLDELRETRLRLSRYIFNGLFKDIYSNAKRIKNLPSYPLGEENFKFAYKYLKKINQVIGLREKLLTSRYAKNSDDIASREEINFIYRLRDKLRHCTTSYIKPAN
jgi:hypothetical protein